MICYTIFIRCYILCTIDDLLGHIKTFSILCMMYYVKTPLFYNTHSTLYITHIIDYTSRIMWWVTYCVYIICFTLYITYHIFLNIKYSISCIRFYAAHYMNMHYRLYLVYMMHLMLCAMCCMTIYIYIMSHYTIS